MTKTRAMGIAAREAGPHRGRRGTGLVRVLIAAAVVSSLALLACAAGAAADAEGQRWPRIEILPVRSYRGACTSLAFSPDGRYLACGGYEGAIRVLDVQSGRVLTVLTGDEADDAFVAFGPERRYLASASSGGTVALWDLVSGRVLRVFERLGEGVEAASFSPDGKWLAGGMAKGDVVVWEVRSGRVALVLEGHEGAVDSVAFGPKGEKIVSGAMDGSVRMWDVRTARQVWAVDCHDGWVTCVAFSTDGRYVASTGVDGSVALREASTGGGVWTLSAHVGAADCLCIGPFGRRGASGGQDRTVAVWSLGDGRVLHRLSGHGADVVSVAMSPDGKYVASGAENGEVCLWDLATGKLVRLMGLERGWTQSVSSVPEGEWIACGSTDGLFIWKLTEPVVCRMLGEAGAGVTSVALGPGGQQVAVAREDGAAELWGMDSAQVVRTFNCDDLPPLRVAYSAEGRYVACAGSEGIIQVWDATSGAEVRRWAWGKGDVHSLSFARRAATLAVGGVGWVALWSPTAGRGASWLELLHGGGGDCASSADFSPGGEYLAVAGESGRVWVYDVATLRVVRVLEAYLRGLSSVAFDPAGLRLLCGSEDGSVRVWDITSGAQIWTARDHAARVTCVGFAARGRLAVSGSRDGTVVVRDSRTGRPVVLLVASSREWIAFTPQGYYTGSRGADKLAAWRVRRGPDDPGMVAPLGRYRERFYRPDVVRLALKLGSAVQAVTHLIEQPGPEGGGGTSRPVIQARHYAVLVGIDGYPDDVGRLQCCCSDARALAGALRRYCGVPEENIFVLTDDQSRTKWKPTLGNIYRVLNSLIRLSRRQKIERIYFAFSGHGYQIGRENYYLLADVRAEDLIEDVGADVLPHKSLALGKIKEKLLATGAPQVLVLLDACRDVKGQGRGVRTGRDLAVEMAAAVDRLELPRGFVIIRATRADERSYEWKEKRHGVFTYALIEALSGAADADGDGSITLLELQAHLERETPRVAMRAGAPVQTPTVKYEREVTNASRYVIAWVGRR